MRSFDAVLADLATALGPPEAVFVAPEPPATSGAWWTFPSVAEVHLDQVRAGLCLSAEGPAVGGLRAWWLDGTPDARMELTPLNEAVDSLQGFLLDALPAEDPARGAPRELVPAR